jgi:hypothetical protein
MPPVVVGSTCTAKEIEESSAKSEGNPLRIRRLPSSWRTPSPFPHPCSIISIVRVRNWGQGHGLKYKNAGAFAAIFELGSAPREGVKIRKAPRLQSLGPVRFLPLAPQRSSILLRSLPGLPFRLPEMQRSEWRANPKRREHGNPPKGSHTCIRPSPATRTW